MAERAEAVPVPSSNPVPLDLWLAQTLVAGGLLTAEQVDEIKRGRSAGIWVGAVEQGYTTDDQILQVLSERFKVPIADLSTLDRRVAPLLPESLARKYGIIPISADDSLIRIATADPRDLAMEQTLSFVTGRDVQLQAAAPSAIAEKLDDLYRPEAAINRLVDGLNPPHLEQVDEPLGLEPDRDPALEAPMSRLVDAMIADAVRERASDIHAEPLPEGTIVRYRIDGVLREVMRLPVSAGPILVRRVKILARMDVTDPLHPHDGRAGVRVDGKPVDLRISTVPVARRGEKVVIRILDKVQLRSSIADLELPDDERQAFERLLGYREGIILVTGPTGSGKTTTLYAALNQLRTGKVNIVTVEDPVEYDIPGISQLQVNDAQGFTFATALRSVLRQDPDIVLVGEIRDAETASIAVRAGLSGHLVLSTLHTNDAASAVVRMRDLGEDLFKLAAVLKGVVAQRLVRKLCPACSVPISVDDLPGEAQPPADRTGPVQPRRHVGCKACSGTGYRGRIAVFEIMPVDERVARLVGTGGAPEALVSAARPQGMRTLWESGLQRLWCGQTSLEEIIRVLGERVQEDGVITAAQPWQEVIPDLPSQQLPDFLPIPTRAEPVVTRIMVADDDPQMRRLIKMILERDGHQVVEASDGLDALEALERGRVDLMILDLDMPRLDGLGVLEELRARVMTSALPVIVLTARGDDTEARVLDLGAQDFLRKPVQPQSLQARVRGVLRRTAIA